MGLDQRIVSNVQKMVDQNAPPSDIDGYLKQEGLTPELFKSAITEPKDQPLYKAAGRGAISSFGSAVKGIGGAASALLRPDITIPGIEQLIEGGVAKLPGGKQLLSAEGMFTKGNTPEETARAEQAANALGQDVKNAYGTWARTKETLATDPFRLLTDLSVGAGAAGKLANLTKAQKAGDILAKTSEIANPFGAVTKPMSYAEQFFGKKPQDLANEKSINATRDATIKQSLDAGYTIPRSAYNPSATTNTLESIGGKASIGQEATKANQAVTDKLARKYLNLPEGTAFSEQLITDLLDARSKPYEEVKQLPMAQIPTSKNGMIGSRQTRSGAEILDELKKTKDISRASWKAINNGTTQEVNKTIDIANEADAKVAKLENEIEELAKVHNQPELLNQLKQSRKELAKIYTIEKAMNPANGEINAANIKQQYNKNVPLTDEAKVIADFGNSFSKLASEGSKVPNPDVSQTKAIMATLLSGGGAGGYFGGPMGAVGGALAASAPFIVPPTAKAAALSKFLQKMPNYEPSTIKKMMKASPNANPLAAALYEMHNATNQGEQ